MQAFLLERLFPTGWRRSGELYWRLSDADQESHRAIQQQKVRGIRVLAVRINPDAVIELMADAAGGTDDERLHPESERTARVDVDRGRV